MADIRISQLPTAPSAISGSELVPIVQNGQTVQTTVYDLVNSPTQTQTYLTVNNEPSLPNSRRIGGGLGIGTTDGGAQGNLLLYLNAVSGSLENASTGIIVKNSSTTVASRSLAISGAGLSVSNANGLAGNPTIGLSGLPLVLAGISGTGFLVTAGGTTLSTLTIVGTTNQTTVAGGDGTSTPTIGLASNPILPGFAGVTIPSGGTGSRAGSNGTLRYNTDINAFEGYANGSWGTIITGTGVASFSAGTTGFTPATATTGAVVLGGTLNVANGGTGATTLTG